MGSGWVEGSIEVLKCAAGRCRVMLYQAGLLTAES